MLQKYLVNSGLYIVSRFLIQEIGSKKCGQVFSIESNELVPYFQPNFFKKSHINSKDYFLLLPNYDFVSDKVCNIIKTIKKFKWNS